MPTLGVDFSAKNLPAKDNSTIRLHLWDVAGLTLDYLVKERECRSRIECSGDIKVQAIWYFLYFLVASTRIFQDKKGITVFQGLLDMFLVS